MKKDTDTDIYDGLCDFSNVIKIIIEDITKEYRPNQPELFKQLFKQYSNDETSKDDTFSESSVSKYINGEMRIKDKVRKFYLTGKNKFMLEEDIIDNLFTIMSDYSSAVSEIYDLLDFDVSISETKREYLKNFYTKGSEQDEAVFLAEILRYTFERPFIKHDKNKRRNFEKSIQIYQSVWEDEPELLNEKYKEIQARYIQAGIDIAQTYFLKNK